MNQIYCRGITKAVLLNFKINTMAGSSNKAIYGAIIANSLIAISKFIAAAATGSASMLSEGIHSLVDTGNGILLLFGIKKSKKPADIEHPFGYGNEIYFWSFIVAILIFALGGGIALYEGIHHLQHPAEITNPKWNYIVLCLAIVFEGTAFRVAMKQFNKTRGDESFYQSLKDSKDLPTVAIIIEDSAAVIGLLIALICLILGQVTGIVYFDGLGSVLIGLLLISVSFFFAIECKGLLVGEGLMLADINKIKDILRKNDNILVFGPVLSLYFGPNEVLVNLDVNFKDELTSDEIEQTIDKVEAEIKKEVPKVNRIYIEAESLKKKK